VLSGIHTTLHKNNKKRRNKMERTKRISTQSLAIAVLTVLLVASLVMSMTGAWFTATDGTTDDGHTFGTITLGSMNSSFSYTLGENSGDVIMPGDTIEIDFDVENTGTADMWVKFQLIAQGGGETHLATQPSGLTPSGYSYESGDDFFYRDAPLQDGDDAVEPILFELEIPGTTTTGEGDTIDFVLNLDAVQVANNLDRSAGDGWTALGEDYTYEES
jgi:hypothetical protein